MKNTDDRASRIVRITLAAKESVAYVIGERAVSTYDEAQLLLALRDSP